MTAPAHRAAEYKAKRQERREMRKQRAARLKKWVPMIEVLCKRHSIAMQEIPSGYQFRVGEYILNWWLTTNRIIVQYAGSGDHKEYDGQNVPGEPKIMTALKKLVSVTEGDQQSTKQ